MAIVVHQQQFLAGASPDTSVSDCMTPLSSILIIKDCV